MSTDLAPRVLTFTDQAQAVAISSQVDLDAAVELGLGIKALIAEAEAHHAETIRKAHEAHKSAIAMRDRIVAPLKEAQKILGCKVTAYQLEQDRLRLLAEAEAARLAEERAIADAQRLALDAIDQGAGIEEVEAIAAMVEPVAVALPERPKTAGVSKPVARYSCKVTNQALLPEQYKMPNQTLLDGMARSMKTLFSVPGCELVTQYGTNWTGRK